MLSMATARARVVIRGGLETVRLRRGTRLVIVNGDIRAHTIAGATLDKPGAACIVKFPKRGVYTFESEPGPALVAGLSCDTGPKPAMLEVVVS